MTEATKHILVLLVTGPRQSGRSTTLQRLCSSHTYVSFDDPVVQAESEKDPTLFLADHPAPVICDEIQDVPDLLSGIKVEVDRSKRKGSSVLTGSQAFSLMAGITESLAGRVAVLEPLPSPMLKSRLSRISMKTGHLKTSFEDSFPVVSRRA